jgi:hypothetical protein
LPVHAETKIPVSVFRDQERAATKVSVKDPEPELVI